jgi:hypothetical protein
MAYLLDANVFIEAKNRYYGLDFCPAFWRWLEAQNLSGHVFSIENVLDELRSGSDSLTEWAEVRGSRFFLPADPEMLPAFASVSSWIQGQSYEPAAVSAFLQGADYFLIVHALAHKHTVVTQEVASDSRRRIKIPNACLGVGVRFVNPFEMLCRERARFVLAPRPSAPRAES